MDAQKIKTLLVGMAALNRQLAIETKGDGYFDAVVDRFATNLIMAGTGLQGLLRADDDTAEMEPVIVENIADTREFPKVTVYDEQGKASA